MAFKQLDDFRFQLPLTTEILSYPDLFLNVFNPNCLDKIIKYTSLQDKTVWQSEPFDEKLLNSATD